MYLPQVRSRGFEGVDVHIEQDNVTESTWWRVSQLSFLHESNCSVPVSDAAVLISLSFTLETRVGGKRHHVHVHTDAALVLKIRLRSKPSFMGQLGNLLQARQDLVRWRYGLL